MVMGLLCCAGIYGGYHGGCRVLVLVSKVDRLGAAAG